MNLLQILLIIAVGIIMAIIDVMPYMKAYKGNIKSEDEKQIDNK